MFRQAVNLKPRDFYVPGRRWELIHYLKTHGIKKGIYKMKLGQLQAIYFKLRQGK